MTVEHFDPIDTELKPGINLIEASAGTGKTYAIAMLVMRFVVEKELDIKRLLVVTFTKAATEELKNRIRKRLSDAKNALNPNLSYPEEQDDVLVRWLQNLGLPLDVVRRRLESALLDIDQAGIFTIHSFCQRILAEHALESGQLFDCELTGDIAAIKQACVDDFWRRTLYQRSPWEVAILTSEQPSPDALLKSVDFIDSQHTLYPEYVDIDSLFVELKTLTNTASRTLEPLLSTIRSALADGKFKPGYRLPEDSRALSDWLQQQAPVLPDFSMLTQAGLMAGLHGSKFRSSKKNPLPPEEQKRLYLRDCGIDSEAFDRLDRVMAQVRIGFRRALLQNLNEQLRHALQQQNVMSFDELIIRLSEALQGDKGELLIEELRQRYQAALIDEFQDTDQHQWQIFSTLFSGQGQSLFLIGDPKQAIYKFRGADIFSYFVAQQQAQYHFTLDKNWRSHPHLVTGVNRLFQKQRPFLFEQLDFKPVKAALSAENGSLYHNSDPLPPLVLCQLEASNGNRPHWIGGKAAETIRVGVINEILDLLNQPCLVRKGNTERRLQPGDIAILVRTNTQAREYQQTLNLTGIPAVLNSKESVYASDEACDLYKVLQAIAQPGHIPLLKQALTVNWFNLDGQQLYRLGSDEAALDRWIAHFQNYQLHWQQYGLMSMLQTLFNQEDVTTHLSVLPQAERILTNLHHLIELLQQAATDEHLGINKTLDRLQHSINKAIQGENGSDEQQLRLESDEDAVKLITMHGSKGLEYPVVFCPYLWQRSDRLRTENNIIRCHMDGQIIADIGSPLFEQRRQQALEEELAEDLRLFYVAVTRAKLRCYLVWADVRTLQQANDSAMAWLLDLGNRDFTSQQNVLRGFSLDDEQTFAYRILPAESELSGRYRKHETTAALNCRQRNRILTTHWQMSSYTALSALSLDDAPELPQDKADEQSFIQEISGAGEKLPKGAQTGNVLHALLETLSFASIAAENDISAQRNKACMQYGLHLEQPELIDQILQAVVRTPLSTDKAFCLQHIPDRECLKEMPFYLALREMNTSKINEILQQCPAYQPLNNRQMSGFLTGFIDLICQYKEKFYVIDYKSNSLDNYRPEHLTEAMREHNYGLQYWLYSLVLHRYLQQRLPDYDYHRHFGGIKYLFLRGMSPATPASGVFMDLPALDGIEKLSALFFRN